jgi:HIV Tat-specific factor 1
MVYLKPMFTLEELASDPQAILDIKEDIRDECARLGEVTNVILYDAEADGVASVRFREPAPAMACVRLMNGRNFGGNKVVAWIAEGSERFKKAPTGAAAMGTDDEDEYERLNGFGKWLEDDAEAKKQAVEAKD